MNRNRTSMAVIPCITCSSVALAAALLLGACDANRTGSAAVRSDSAGVELVKSGSSDRELDWKFTPLFRVGGEDEGPESFYYVGFGNVAADDSGRFAVLDLRARRVVRFNRDGELLDELGRSGEGPGELSFPQFLAIGADASVNVLDIRKASIVRFDAGGEVLREIPFRFSSALELSRRFALVEGGLMGYWQVADQDAEDIHEVLQLATASDTTLITERYYPRPQMADFSVCGGGMALPPVFHSALLWDVRGSSLVVVSGPAYSIDIYDGTRLVRRASRDFRLRSASMSDAVAELGEGLRVSFGRGVCTVPAAEVATKRGIEDYVPWIAQLVIAPNGELWVQRTEIGAERADVGVIDVFDASGAYEGSLPQGTAFPLAFLGNDRYVTAEKDSLDVWRVVGYEVERR